LQKLPPCGEFTQHHIDGLCPSGQELPGIQRRRGFLPECPLLDQDHIDAAPHGRFSRAETRQPAAHNQQLAAQALAAAGRRRKPHLIVIGFALLHLFRGAIFSRA
jgi:hypothetical protein